MAAKRSILIVDDIPLMRTMLSRYIRSLGLRSMKATLAPEDVAIIEAANGKEALDVVRTQRVDLIFLDLMMPEMDGLTFLEILRKEEKDQAPPVIICTALGEKETLEKAMSLGARSYVAKPFTLTALEHQIREALNYLQAQAQT